MGIAREKQLDTSSGIERIWVSLPFAIVNIRIICCTTGVYKDLLLHHIVKSKMLELMLAT